MLRWRFRERNGERERVREILRERETGVRVRLRVRAIGERVRLREGGICE